MTEVARTSEIVESTSSAAKQQGELGMRKPVELRTRLASMQDQVRDHKGLWELVCLGHLRVSGW